VRDAGESLLFLGYGFASSGRVQALRVQPGHARVWQGWRGLAHPLGVRHPQTPASRSGVLVDWSLTAGLCAAHRDAVEGFPWALSSCWPSFLSR